MANIFTPTIINLSGPWNIAREDCIGDSLGFINANTNYLAYGIEALSATTLTRINSLSSTLVNSNAGAVVIFQDQKPSGTNGGSSVVTWQTRTLNTKVADTNNLCAAPVSDTFTLPAGTWHIRASAPGWAVLVSKLRLFNVTTSLVQAFGTSEYSYVNTTYATYSQITSFLDTVVQLTTNTTFRIEHYTSRAQGTNGLGVANGVGTEVYTNVVCTKIK